MHYKNLGMSVTQNFTFADALAYADDFVLLFASLNGLRVLLNVYSEVAGMYNIIFNVTKSVAGFLRRKTSARIPV